MKKQRAMRETRIRSSRASTVAPLNKAAAPVVHLRASPGVGSSGEVLALQKSVGNRAVSRLIERQDAPPQPVIRRLPTVALRQNHPATSGPRSRDVIELQQRALGNAAVQRLFGRKKKIVVPTAPDTRSDERKTFDAKTFEKLDWVPSTGTGKFDAIYKPKDGVLRIVMRVHFDFQDADPAYRDTAEDPKEMKWSSSGKKDWSAKWSESVLGKWGSIAPFTCDKAGFTDVIAKPQIEVQHAKDAGSAHYSLSVSKSFRKKGGGMRAGGASGVDRVGGGMFQEQDAYEKINKSKVSQHLRAGEAKGNIMPAYERDREKLTSLLSTVPAIGFEAGSDAFDDSGEACATTLAQTILRLRATSALADLHPINVMVGIDTGEPRTLLLTRFRKIKEILVGAGVTNLLSAKQANAPHSWAHAEEAPETQQVKDEYMNRWDRYTSAHEFGHMIGLLDEYCPATSPDLIVKMVNDGAIGAGDTTLSEYAKGKKGNNEANQKAYAGLLTKTNLAAPNWARPTASKDEKGTSLMSGGFEVLRQHHITLWEVLAEMTKTDVPETNWKV